MGQARSTSKYRLNESLKMKGFKKETRPKNEPWKLGVFAHSRKLNKYQSSFPNETDGDH